VIIWLDASMWRQRARRELLAAGEIAGKRTVKAGELVPQEPQIVRLDSEERPSRTSVPGCSSVRARPDGTCARGSRQTQWSAEFRSRLPRQAGTGPACATRPGPSSTEAPLPTRRSSWHPSWPPTPSPTADHASPASGSSSRRSPPGDCIRSKSRTRATLGPTINPRHGRLHELDMVQAIAGHGNWGINGYVQRRFRGHNGPLCHGHSRKEDA
jgi:hypothetical protein